MGCYRSHNMVVTGTTNPALDDLLPIALDMTASLTGADRSRRLLEVVARALPCDAAAILRLDGHDLVPVAVHGLSVDTLGRRFARREHPRLDAICESEEPTLFPGDSSLPDPYDGLIEGSPHLDVHSCLGCPLRVEGRLVGVLTVDALAPGAFDAVDRRFLVHLAALAAAAMHTGDLIEALERHAQHQGLVARTMLEDVFEHRGGLLLGDAPPMHGLRREIDLVAASALPVLVTGETGVGKELVIRTLHARSPRAGQPLVYVNCAALPESIIESELFGHEKGSFTGATEARPGRFRVADGASLFLDEVGELPLHLQPKLLRALQDGEIQPVGADRTVHVDVRILAATNRDLEAEVRAGRFRADLLHRLDVCRIRVPPLRAHREDVPVLVGHFADRMRRQLGTGPIRFTPGTLARLSAAPWPGNVRELDNAVARAVVRAAGRVPPGDMVVVDVGDVGIAPAADREEASGSAGLVPLAEGRTLREAVEDYQRASIGAALRRADGSWAAAARALGMHRSNLHHLARRLGLR